MRSNRLSRVSAIEASVCDALNELKARDIVVLDTLGNLDIVDGMIIATGTSSRHVRSLVDQVVEKARVCGAYVIGVEGQKNAKWVLIDLGDILVHVMQADTRAFYDLERLWNSVQPAQQTL